MTPISHKLNRTKETAYPGIISYAAPVSVRFPPGVNAESIDSKLFSLYDIFMPVNITQAQLDTWVSEAEEGYDPEALKKRGRGRPGRGAEPAQVVAVRLTVDELSALDRLATKKNLTRSELVRQAISTLTAA